MLRAPDYVWRRTRHTLHNLQDLEAIERAEGGCFELWYGDAVTFSLLPQLTHARRRREFSGFQWLRVAAVHDGLPVHDAPT